ncbi:MAG: 1,6-anhydro-N-acetylmuramyl-L-alanine amidase AmpD [Cocleimonas sp.]|nr:1,6-anhydro-N-acetylmuramyl-L-alanine amidase AmpD [Cocleimonas sp.]
MQNKRKIDQRSGLLNTARQYPSPNFNNRPNKNDISLIVIHNISLPPEKFGGDWIDKLFTNQLPKDAHPFFAEIYTLRVSSHLLIRRNGEIVQYVPFHKRAWHAGISQFQGKQNCNDFSIGIELEGTDNQSFTEKQYQQLIITIKQLQQQYPSLKKGSITGHQQIAPERKTDPGPYFDWQQLSRSLGQTLPANACLLTKPATKQTTIIDLLRHGEPIGGRMYRGGGTDHSLSNKGWTQMKSSISAYYTEEKTLPWQYIVSSPLLRCCEFAKELSHQHHLPLEIQADFKEAGYGCWEGLTPKEIKERDAEKYWAFFDDPVNCRPENAESLAGFTKKISNAFDNLLQNHQGQHILLISHLAVTRAIIATILSSSLASQQLIDIPFAGMLRIINDQKGLRIFFR